MTSPEPQDQRRTAILEHGQGVLDLAAQAQGFLVDQQDIGIEGLGRMANDRGPHGQGLFDADVQAERGIFAVAQLDDSGDADKIHPCAKIEAADNGGTRKG